MHVRRTLTIALVGATVAVASQAQAALNATNHSQWDQDYYYNGFGGSVPGSPVEYSVGFSTIADYDGRVLSNAAVTTNLVDSSPLTTISSHLFSGTDANLYKISITNPASFSASIPSTSLVLALFSSNGTALAASIGGASDAITGANAGLTLPGIYYIGIANVGGYPENAAAQNIFALTGTAGVFTPVTGDAVLAADPQIAWTITSGTAGLLTNTSFTAAGSTITLTGSGFAVTPEPTTLALLAGGAMVLISRRRGNSR
ncbi:MAG TPA: PEP-CTERM sorting domain-containing protein [Phycisphaerae bacterium]|nr:PEP-CTERM sorting domain-containing protein [Phycisphaerae bacterium]